MENIKQHDHRTTRRPDCVTEIRMGNTVLVVSGFFKKDTFPVKIKPHPDLILFLFFFIHFLFIRFLFHSITFCRNRRSFLN